MNKQTLISIIIPVYNVEKYITHCLNSVINQTYENLEVICVNDGSTDNSLNILKEFKEKDKRIKVINKENGGQSSARNIGLKEFSGDYVFFLDSDDYIHPQTIEILYTCLKSANTQISECDYILTSESFTTFKTYEKSDNFTTVKNPLKAYAERKKYFTPNITKKLYSRETITGLSFIEGIVWEDVPFTIELYDKVQATALVKLPLYFYYKNTESTSKTNYTKYKIDCYVKVINFISKFLENKKYEKEKCIGLIVRRLLNDNRKIKDLEIKKYIQSQLKALYEQKIISYRGLEMKKHLLLWKMLNREIKNKE